MKIHLGFAIRNALKRCVDCGARPWLEWRVRDITPPQHIGFILDGNRRYARELGFEDLVAGHALGAEKVEEALRWCREYGVRVVTIWIFSVENFKRDPAEVDELMQLMEQKAQNLLHSEEVHRERVQVNFIGRLKLLPGSLQKAITEVAEATAHYDRFVLNVAVAYSGREEIVDACRSWLRERPDEPAGTVAESFDEAAVETHLYTAGLRDPDLVIRTSGEVRSSGFLLWQTAYSEYSFCRAYWPQFSRADFLRTLLVFSRRQRRFGR